MHLVRLSQVLDKTVQAIIFATLEVYVGGCRLINIRCVFPGEMDDLICALKNLDAFRDFTPGGNRKRGRGATPARALSYASDTSSKNRLTTMSTTSQDRIFTIA